jgi:hypothetical protein
MCHLDCILYGEGRPHQTINVDQGLETRRESIATEIRAYGISGTAEFAVTLHLKEAFAPTNAASTESTKVTLINISFLTQTSNSPTPAEGGAVPQILNNANPTKKICAVISVWDLRSENNNVNKVESLSPRKTMERSNLYVAFDFPLPEGLDVMSTWESFRASISISAQGTKVVLGGVEKTHFTLPFTAFVCKHKGEANLFGAGRTIRVDTRSSCKELRKFSGYGVFHRIDPNPTKTTHDDDNERFVVDNERFVVYNESVLEVYSTKDSGWKLLQRLTLSPNSGLHRGNCYGIVQSLRGRYFAWTGDPGVVSIWDMEIGKPVSNIFIKTDTSPYYAVLSPDGSKIAISVMKTIQIHDSTTGILLGTHTRGVMSDNNSEVVLGNEYFVVRDNSRMPEQKKSTDFRSVVRIKDMKMVDSTFLHEDYSIVYPLTSLTIAAYRQVCEYPRLFKP